MYRNVVSLAMQSEQPVVGLFSDADILLLISLSDEVTVTNYLPLSGAPLSRQELDDSACLRSWTRTDKCRRSAGQSGRIAYDGSP